MVAIAPNGLVFAASLPFDPSSRRSAVAVQVSRDGGLAFERPVLAQSDANAGAFNDKPWIVVDGGASSPHRGRVYVAWTHRFGDASSSVVVRLSDDDGATWSSLRRVSSAPGCDVGAQPLVHPDGSLTVIYQHFDCRRGALDERSQTSRDGGDTFGPVVRIGPFGGREPAGMRTGAIPSAAADPDTGELFVAWQDSRLRPGRLNDIVVSTSTDAGRTWRPARRVTPDRARGSVDRFTPAVAARGGTLHVAYRARIGDSTRVETRLVLSVDGGRSFGAELAIGPPTDLSAAPEVSGRHGRLRFLGDYMGLAVGSRAAVVVWPAAFVSEEQFRTETWAAVVSW